MNEWFFAHSGLQRVHEPDVAECRAVVARIPEHHAAHMDLAVALYEAGELTESEAEARRAMELGYPCPGLALNHLACIAKARGDLDGMMDRFSEAAKIDPQHYVLIQNVQAARAWFEAGGAVKKLPLNLLARGRFPAARAHGAADVARAARGGLRRLERRAREAGGVTDVREDAGSRGEHARVEDEVEDRRGVIAVALSIERRCRSAPSRCHSEAEGRGIRVSLACLSRTRFTRIPRGFAARNDNEGSGSVHGPPSPREHARGAIPRADARGAGVRTRRPPRRSDAGRASRLSLPRTAVLARERGGGGSLCRARAAARPLEHVVGADGRGEVGGVVRDEERVR